LRVLPSWIITAEVDAYKECHSPPFSILQSHLCIINSITTQLVKMAEHRDDTKIEVSAHHESVDSASKKKLEDISVEAATRDLNRIDLDKLSKDAINIKSRAARRLALVILIQGLSKLTPLFRIF
jgi:hypothetical protein